MAQDLDDNRVGCDPDAYLLNAVRRGDREAFGELYGRYESAAHSFACRLLGTSQGADDLVAEAFTKVLRRIVSGGGPTAQFRAYLLTTVRTTFYKQLAGERLVDRHAELPEQVLPTIDRDLLIEKLDADLAVQALESLPERWRTVLVHLEIENRSTSAVADLLGLQPNALAALAFRAREGLRVAYVQMHVKAAVNEECRLPASNLAAWLCGRLGRGLRVRVQHHIESCASCAAAVGELSDLLTQLRRCSPVSISLPAPANRRAALAAAF
ncbi:sigma-70 family RNA polymerase sigma factor [Lentzea tibetensis]|uniref:Sigma-70 family RNA polymerase sigma factor n=1 Tax=Lentzea tibetensis TaxID=2591470 RepID=A0A563EXM1_9PSEU|nr:sigma-70 family RNA polymerase sigma factor [Lentzea tibetensis]TWP52399.1 sigma-70 family RNA polymerase sigma factor [Lentzea tibetensis]